MFTLTYAREFKKQFKRLQRNPQFHIERLDYVLGQLQKHITLEPRYQLHKLTGNFVGCYECHLQPDVLLIFEVEETTKVIYLLQIGSHSDLF